MQKTLTALSLALLFSSFSSLSCHGSDQSNGDLFPGFPEVPNDAFTCFTWQPQRAPRPVSIETVAASSSAASATAPSTQTQLKEPTSTVDDIIFDLSPDSSPDNARKKDYYGDVEELFERIKELNLSASSPSEDRIKEEESKISSDDTPLSAALAAPTPLKTSNSQNKAKAHRKSQEEVFSPVPLAPNTVEIQHRIQRMRSPLSQRISSNPNGRGARVFQSIVTTPIGKK